MRKLKYDDAGDDAANCDIVGWFKLFPANIDSIALLWVLGSPELAGPGFFLSLWFFVRSKSMIPLLDPTSLSCMVSGLILIL